MRRSVAHDAPEPARAAMLAMLAAACELAKLLEDSEVPIARVARLLCFANDRSLRNSMRRFKLSPGAFRRALSAASLVRS